MVALIIGINCDGPLVQDDVTLAKLYDSVGSCYDEMGRPGSVRRRNVEVTDRTWIDTKYKAT